MLEILFAVLVLILLLTLLVMQSRQPTRSAQMLEQQHRAMLTDLHDGLNKQGDRLIAAQVSEAERLRIAVSEELRATRDAVNALQAKQDLLRTEMLAQTLAKLAEQGRADQELIQNSFRNATQHLATSIEALSKTVDGRLELIGGKVNERLDEGFKKTNETFVSVMAPLARRQVAWDRLAKDLDPARLEAMVEEVSLDRAAEKAAIMMAGKLRGRVVVKI